MIAPSKHVVIQVAGRKCARRTHCSFVSKPAADRIPFTIACASRDSKRSRSTSHPRALAGNLQGPVSRASRAMDAMQ